MNWMRWLPWRTVVRRIARSHGFLDPISLFAKLEQFAQPSGLVAPTELLRAGAVLQARGLINSQAIQHNLDWIWPLWVERQFNPNDPAFIPRAFNLTHINLTHRNWTAVGIPGMSELALVDPHGLITPFYDGWSLDAWIFSEPEFLLIPSQTASAVQGWGASSHPSIVTTTERNAVRLTSVVEAEEASGAPICKIRWTASSDRKAWLAVSLRPFNPEGVSFVDTVDLLPDRKGWKVNQKQAVYFDAEPDRYLFSEYRSGDVARRLQTPHASAALPASPKESGECYIGLATAAALFAIQPGQERSVEVCVPMSKRKEETRPVFSAISIAAQKWKDSLHNRCELKIPDARFQALYETALRTLVLHSPGGDVYPGPFTYKRFWFRDAAYILDALLCAGLADRVETVLDRFPSRQTPGGHYLSQDGEWDSNGQALWILRRFVEFTGKDPKPAWRSSIARGAAWIRRKCLPLNPPSPHAGLLPPGFSAEHFGPSDYYYWDDFWGVAGFQAAAYLAERYGDVSLAVQCGEDAQRLMRSVEESLETASQRVGKNLVPSSPYRRMDPAAIGSMVAGYPLRLWPSKDMRLLGTAEFLLRKCCQSGAFYQEISHSGMNAYLTLHIGQVLLRAGDPRFHDLMRVLADLASPTGQWPEAIHPRTLGGCMGDGQHVWAAAEWILMLRNCLVREEGSGRLILGSGIPAAWLVPGNVIEFGPAPTAYGTMTLRIEAQKEQTQISWEGSWHGKEPVIEVRLPGADPTTATAGQTQMNWVTVR